MMPDDSSDRPQTPEDAQEQLAEAHVKQMMEPDRPVRPGDVVRVRADGVAGSPARQIQSAPELVDEDGTFTPSAPPAEPAPEPGAASEDSETDEAVDDIVKTEGDDLLQAQDAKAEAPVVMHPNLWERFKNGLQSWWDSPVKRYSTLGGIVVVLAAVTIIPVTRLFALNLVGLRGNVAVQVLDSTNNLPLKNVQLSVAGQTATTDSKGKAVVHHVRLGKQTVSAHKEAFADWSKAVSIGPGTTKLPAVSLKAVGTQFTFTLADYLSGKPVAGAEVTSGQASAQSDKSGKAILTVQPSDKPDFTATVSAKNYRSEKLKVSTTDKAPQKVALVPAGKEVFISKQSGKYDLYKADLDGKNREVLLAGTGNETPSLSLSVSPDGSEAALVSTRDNQRNSDGYLLSTLTLVDVDTGATVTLEHAESVQLLGWSDTRLVYQETVAGASAANPNRQRLVSYDYHTGKRLQLASANYFNGALLVGNKVYYAVSNTDPSTSPGFSAIGVDATGKQLIASKEVWTVLRTDFSTIALQTPGGWLQYTIGSSGTKATTAPGNYNSREYLTGPDGKTSLWTDSRDGKGVLLTHNNASGKDTVITSQSGLANPVRWINDDTVVYRVVTGQETADYAVSLQGGQPRKITDVTSTY